MTVSVTGTVVDVTGRKDSREWRAWSPVYREGTGGAVVTYREQDVQVVAGALTARLEPGPCFIQNPDGDRWLVTVPDTDTELWPLIAVAVAIPPGTPADELNAAVTAYFDANPVDVGPEGPPNVLEIGTVVSGPTADATITGTSPTQTLNLTLPKGDKGDPGTPGTSGDWATLTNKPAVIAAGADAATARSAISAQASDSDLTAIAALSPANDDVVQRKSGAWTNRTPAQLKTDLGLTKSDVGLGNVDNTSDVNKPISTATQTALNAKQATSEKGQANGYAGLDSGGKVPVAQLPSSIMEYKGTWNASTNAPTLADGTGDNGDVYRVSVGGTRNLGSGNITFDVGDYAIYNGTVWEKSDTTDAVASVAGKTGVVTLVKGDVGLGSVDNTADAAKAVLSATKLATARTINGTSFDGSANVVLSPQTVSVTNIAAPSIAVANPFAVLNDTALGAAVTGVTVTGTPADGWRMLLRFKDNGTSRTIALGASFRAMGVAIPAATTASKWLVIGAVYNGVDSIWDVVAVGIQA